MPQSTLTGKQMLARWRFAWYVDGMADDLEAQLAEAQKSVVSLRRTMTDRRYMIDALVQMLGPKGLSVWKLWCDQGVERIHTSWGPGAAALSGEERAQVHLDFHEAAKNAKPVDNIDGDMPQINVREFVASLPA